MFGLIFDGLFLFLMIDDVIFVSLYAESSYKRSCDQYKPIKIADLAIQTILSILVIKCITVEFLLIGHHWCKEKLSVS